VNRLVRRSAIGAVAGALASSALIATVGRPLLSFTFGIALGAAYSASIRPTRGAAVDQVMAGAAFGVPFWGLISVIGMPLLSGGTPAWNAEAIRAYFPMLVGWVLYGALLGLCLQLLTDAAERVMGPESAPRVADPGSPRRILILGGGFSGMRVAESLEQRRGRSAISVTLVSETNALLFTPMLAEVAGGNLEPSHISTPLRSSLHRTRFIRGVATEIDLTGRRVILGGEAGEERREVPYDELVLALGAVSNYRLCSESSGRSRVTPRRSSSSSRSRCSSE